MNRLPIRPARPVVAGRAAVDAAVAAGAGNGLQVGTSRVWAWCSPVHHHHWSH